MLKTDNFFLKISWFESYCGWSLSLHPYSWFLRCTLNQIHQSINMRDLQNVSSSLYFLWEWWRWEGNRAWLRRRLNLILSDHRNFNWNICMWWCESIGAFSFLLIGLNGVETWQRSWAEPNMPKFIVRVLNARCKSRYVSCFWILFFWFEFQLLPIKSASVTLIWMRGGRVSISGVSDVKLWNVNSGAPMWEETVSNVLDYKT